MSVRKNKAGAATAPHLEAIHKLFGGTIDWDFNRVECSAVLGEVPSRFVLEFDMAQSPTT